MINKFSLNFLGNGELISISAISLFLSAVVYFFVKKILKKDKYIIISITTCIYTVISFYNLGSIRLPKTYWQPVNENQEIIFEILEENTYIQNIYSIFTEGDTNSNPNNFQINSDGINLYGSNDLKSWNYITTLDNGRILQFNKKEVNSNYKYIKLLCLNINNTLSEIAFINDKVLNISIYEDKEENSKYPASLLIDEQDIVPMHPTYYDEGYFDEVYHPRNAYEIANGQFLYTTVHPLLATSIMALSIKIFGLSPFSWRLPGAIAGVIMIPVFYLIIKKLLKKDYLANIGAIILACDFMHITTSRIGTLEPFSVLFIMLMFYFMIKYFYEQNSRKELHHLFWSGLFMGIGISSKWTAVYSAVSLAIILFFGLYTKHKNNKTFVIKTIIYCILFFIIIPISIYFLSFYFPKIYRENHFTVENIIKYNLNMFNYHKDLNVTHPYQSYWYEWLFDIQPVWYYSGTSINGNRLTISCFSNPIIAYTSLLTLITSLSITIKNKSKEGFIIISAIACAFLPWISISRCLFAYHYYPSTIFMILSMLFTFDYVLKNNIVKKKYINFLTLAIIIVFIMFLPVICGFETNSSYYNSFLRWLPSWYFGA